MRAMIWLFCVLSMLALGACGGKAQYKQQLDFLREQVAANHAAAASRADRLAERETACAGLTDAGAIAACMLGITATTLADRSGSNSDGPAIVMPPAPPKSALEIGAGLLVETIRTGAPIAMGIVQSNNSRKQSIDSNRQLFGFLGGQSRDWSAFAASAVDAERDTATAAVNVLPALAPTITVSGNGNNIGDGNTSTVDQSTTLGDRLTQGDGGTVAIDRSHTGRDRQDGTGNRQHADDITTTTVTTINCSPAAAAGAPGAGGAAGGDGIGGSGGDVSAIDCAARGP